MNPNYSSPRQFNPAQINNHPPFYNPQPKELSVPFPNNPPISKSPTSLQFLNSQTQHPSSKSYTLKPAFQPLKANTNNSAYLKSSIQTTSTQSNFANFSPSYPKVAGEMSKSSFYDPPRAPEHPINFTKTNQRLPINTPNRRQPRYSEPANMQPAFELSQDTKSSFIPYGSSKGLQNSKQQQDIHFFKKNSTPEPSKEQQKKKTWLKKTTPTTVNKSLSFTLASFELVRNLGSGKYGKVFLARQKNSGFICALKMIDKAVLIQQEIVEQFIRQVKIQMFLNHPNIIKMYGCFEDQQHIYIILEIAMGGQLFQQFKRSEPLAEVKAAAFMKQICTSIDQLHSNKIIHRDLKPQNIVLHEGVIKLCDFGWSVHLDNKMRTTFCGTPLYVCPQILRGKQYDEKIDIWSVGIMMYEMLVGESPFKINKEEELIKIVKDQISIPSYVYVSKQGRDFLDKCLQKNPNDRVTIKELSNHPFLIKNAEKQKAEKKQNF